ncbi:MAG TPA: hypothetical protein VIX37_07025, partial [Candidatus Sulfotelmatobacter sp.]
AICNAHILRELQSLIEFDKEPWAEAMRDMLLEANLAVNKAREAGATASNSQYESMLIEGRDQGGQGHSGGPHWVVSNVGECLGVGGRGATF